MATFKAHLDSTTNRYNVGCKYASETYKGSYLYSIDLFPWSLRTDRESMFSFYASTVNDKLDNITVSGKTVAYRYFEDLKSALDYLKDTDTDIWAAVLCTLQADGYITSIAQF